VRRESLFAAGFFYSFHSPAIYDTGVPARWRRGCMVRADEVCVGQKAIKLEGTCREGGKKRVEWEVEPRRRESFCSSRRWGTAILTPLGLLACLHF
jgi:hypothetical protein